MGNGAMSLSGREPRGNAIPPCSEIHEMLGPIWVFTGGAAMSGSMIHRQAGQSHWKRMKCRVRGQWIDLIAIGVLLYDVVPVDE
jgi:hypothetical protein